MLSPNVRALGLLIALAALASMRATAQQAPQQAPQPPGLEARPDAGQDMAPPPPPPMQAPGQPDTPPAPPMSAPDAWLPKPAAEIRVMNKIDSTVQKLTLKAGEAVHIQTLTLKLAGCYVRPDDLPADATARLTVTEDGGTAPLFDGWLLAKEPSLNMLQHAVYDVQLAGCVAP